MDKISFQTIIDSLSCGREIEFVYNNKQYSITNSDGYWNFCCDTDQSLIEKICAFEDKAVLAEWAASYCIEGVSFERIFNSKQDAVSSICIL